MKKVGIPRPVTLAGVMEPRMNGRSLIGAMELQNPTVSEEQTYMPACEFSQTWASTSNFRSIYR